MPTLHPSDIRLINSARVIGGKICYSEKNAATVYSLFQERFLLHKNIYNHKTGEIILFYYFSGSEFYYASQGHRIHDCGCAVDRGPSLKDFGADSRS